MQYPVSSIREREMSSLWQIQTHAYGASGYVKPNAAPEPIRDPEALDAIKLLKSKGYTVDEIIDALNS
jgi:hypothetical protein